MLQYLIDIKDKAEEVAISLEQEDMRVYREDGKKNTTIGCVVFRVRCLNHVQKEVI